MGYLVVLILIGLGLAVDGPPQAGVKLTPDEVRRKLHRCWLVVEQVEAGVKTTDPDRLAGLCIPDGKDWFSWPRRGELSSGHGGRPVRIDPAADPVRLDLRVNVEQRPGRPDRIVVHPCIVRFDGDKLVMAWPRAGVPERELKAGEDYAERPKDFTSTKENRVTVQTLKPCGEYDQD